MKFSVIICAYNAQDHIEHCIKSCINQTFKDFELIIINDGSNDNTRSIIEQYKKTIKIKLHNQENKGLIESRKVGISLSQGDYILFLDSDDWLDKNTLSILNEKSKNDCYDFICFNYISVDENQNVLGVGPLNEKGIFHDYEYLTLILLGKINHHTTNKLIKKTFICNNITIPSNISFAEDLALSCAFGVNKPKVLVLDENLYYYTQRDSSLSKSIGKHRLEIESVNDFIKKQLIENNLMPSFKEKFEFMLYLHNFKYVSRYFFKDEVGEELFVIWKKLKIDTHNNMYLKNIPLKHKIKLYKYKYLSHIIRFYKKQKSNAI